MGIKYIYKKDTGDLFVRIFEIDDDDEPIRYVVRISPTDSDLTSLDKSCNTKEEAKDAILKFLEDYDG